MNKTTTHRNLRTGPAIAKAEHLQAQNDALAHEFDVEGTRYSLSQMLAANADDEDFCEWARNATPGEFFPGIVGCQCLAAGDLSEADLISIDRALAVPDAWAKTQHEADAGQRAELNRLPLGGYRS